MRSNVLKCALTLLTGALAMSGLARAQDNPLPQGTITIVLPFVAGGPVDSVARMIAEKLGPKLTRTFVVENRAGAGGDIAAASVAKATPDGRTWFFTVDSVLTVNPHMNPNRSYDAAMLVPVAKVGAVVLLLGVNAQKVSAKTFPELIALSKTRELSFGSAGIGSPGHLAYEYLRTISDLRAVHVPYRGAALAMQDLVSGQTDASFIVSGALVQHVQAGALRALAVSANKRVAALPDVPTAREAGMGDFEARFANILMAPANTDAAITAFIAREVLALEKDQDFLTKLATVSTDPDFGDAADAAKWLANENARWGRVLAKSKPAQ